MKSNIGFDLDGVVSNPYPRCFLVLKEMYPDNVKKDVWDGPWEIDFGLTSQQVMNCFKECGKRGILKDVPYYRDAKRVLYRLRKHYNIFFLSWRNYIPNAKEDTLYWLDSNKIPYYRLILTYNKFIVAETEKLQFFIDDSAQFCNRMAKTKVPTFLFRRPWNRHEELDALVKVINSWQEVEKLLLPY